MDAKFSQSRNDLHWSIYISGEGFIRWAGYDDDFWWDNIATDKDQMTRIGKDGTRYLLDPHANTVSVVA